MSEMTNGSTIQASLLPPHRRMRVAVALVVFLSGLVAVSWVGNASPNATRISPVQQTVEDSFMNR